jgi:superoxide dismutase, Fe-Mn family
MNRRAFVWGLTGAAAALGFAHAQTLLPPVQAPPPSGPFILPALPYSYAALEPVIDARTMELHHSRHHKAFVDNLNRANITTSALQGLSVEQILGRVSTFPPLIRNNAGGHWNHAFFWQIMAPVGQGGAPKPRLLQAINQTFGSLDGLKTAMNTAGMGRFGSGWVWLIVKPDGQLAITSTPNQDNPLMDVAEMRGTPILGNDLWEHAYYLNYQNRRADYLSAWWQIVNWQAVSDKYEAALPARPRRP